jgi:hypothetical protein
VLQLIAARLPSFWLRMTLEQFEEILMKALLAGADPMLAALRAHYTVAVVTQREFSGVGFVSHFTVSPEAARVTPADFEIQDVFLELQGVENGAMAILFIRGGVLDFLEVVAHTSPWPEQLELHSLYYSSSQKGASPDKRDLDELRRSWRS